MKYLFYLLPGLLNVVMGLFFFITAKRLADAGASALAVTATMPMWALIYAASSFIIGKYTTRNNAVKITLISQFILLVSMIGLLTVPSEKLQYCWLLLSGLGTGLFFAPFQAVVKLFEKVEVSSETFARSASTYTFSWSTGQGLGPMAAALVWGLFDPVNGWKYCYIVNITLVVIVIASLFVMQKFIRRRLAETPAVDSGKSVNTVQSSGLPDVMKSAWVLALGGFTAIAVLRSYLPSFATGTLNLPTSAQGVMLSLISLVQGAVALMCFRTRRWPFRPWGGLLTTVLAVIALVMFAMCSTAPFAWAAAMLFGVFSGIFCFNITYHALANSDKSAKYAAVNETIVGGTAVFAPIAAGMIADTAGVRMPFYCIIIILLVTGIIFTKQLWQYRKF